MRAAIYLRLSTEDPKGSLAAQESGARDWCERNGHSVVAVHRDEGVSGSEWKARPGIVALRAAVSEKPRPFDVVVVRDLDRLGRDAIRLPELLAYLRDEGVAVVEWSTGQTVQLDGMALIIAQLRAGMAQIERETIAHRIRTALERKAQRGLVVGGEVYGYRRERRADGVHYAVDDAEAAVVREVFERRAAGDGLRAIVASLNARGVAGPRGGSWAVSALHEMVSRDRYLGVVRWGVRGSAYKHGTRVATTNANAVEVRDEALRIVGDDLWRAAQSRTDDARRERGLAAQRGRARYLLTGYAMCGRCGGPVSSAQTRRGRTVVKAYACGWARDRGREVCPLTWRRPVERVQLSWLRWCRWWLTEALRVTKPGGVLASFCDWRPRWCASGPSASRRSCSRPGARRRGSSASRGTSGSTLTRARCARGSQAPRAAWAAGGSSAARTGATWRRGRGVGSSARRARPRRTRARPARSGRRSGRSAWRRWASDEAVARARAVSPRVAPGGAARPLVWRVLGPSAGPRDLRRRAASGAAL